MFGNKQVDTEFIGTLLFPGDTPPHPEIWDRLKTEGFDIQEPVEGSGDIAWKRKISHPDFGSGTLMRFTDQSPIPPELIEYCASLTRFEKEDIFNYRIMINYQADGKDSSNPDKRKNHFRILRAVMGDQAEYLLDNISEQIWSKTALDDELMHNEPLGMRSLYTLHFVSLEKEDVRTSPPNEEEAVNYWMHTHGLERMGGFNFDLVDIPGNGDIAYQLSFFDCVAGQIISGKLGPDEKKHHIAGPDLFISMVPAATFNKKVGKLPAERLRPYHADYHDEDRSILCEPRSFFKRKVKPCQWLQMEDLEGMLIYFSEEATEMMSRRAKGSLPLLKKYFSLALEYELLVLVKLAYESSHTEFEHLWFEVHDIGDDYFDATLGNEPWGIENMRAGDRGKHPFSRLTDWMIQTPLGRTNPESTMSIRELKKLIELKELEEKQN